LAAWALAWAALHCHSPLRRVFAWFVPAACGTAPRDHGGQACCSGRVALPLGLETAGLDPGQRKDCGLAARGDGGARPATREPGVVTHGVQVDGLFDGGAKGGGRVEDVAVDGRRENKRGLQMEVVVGESGIVGSWRTWPTGVVIGRGMGTPQPGPAGAAGQGMGAPKGEVAWRPMRAPVGVGGAGTGAFLPRVGPDASDTKVAPQWSYKGCEGLWPVPCGVAGTATKTGPGGRYDLRARSGFKPGGNSGVANKSGTRYGGRRGGKDNRGMGGGCPFWVLSAHGRSHLRVWPWALPHPALQGRFSWARLMVRAFGLRRAPPQASMPGSAYDQIRFVNSSIRKLIKKLITEDIVQVSGSTVIIMSDLAANRRGRGQANPRLPRVADDIRRATRPPPPGKLLPGTRLLGRAGGAEHGPPYGRGPMHGPPRPWQLLLRGRGLIETIHGRDSSSPQK